MNLFDSAFLCLDIGTYGVRGIAHRVRSARIDQSAYFSVDSSDTVFAIKKVVDELEKQLSVRFGSAYVTGNFGESRYEMSAKSTVWNGEHKITAADVRNQIAQIVPPDGFFPMHIVPLRYYSNQARDMKTPVGHVDRQLVSVFGNIFYSRSGVDAVFEKLRGAHIQADAMFDPQFIQSEMCRAENQTTMFIDFGAEFTSASIWTNRGPVWHTKINLGGAHITKAVCEKLQVNIDDADRIKRAVASLIPKEMDRFAPADRDYDFTRGDVNDVVLPILVDIIGQLKNQCVAPFKKYRPTKIVLTGGGAEIEGLRDFIENAFAIVTEALPIDVTVRALADFVWQSEQARRKSYIARHERWAQRTKWISRLFRKKAKKVKKFIPILPSTLCFDMRRPDTYTLFKSGGISMIHVDIMDGFYVDRVAGSIDELKTIRARTNAFLHVHLMTESPVVWADDAIAAGADTVILSTNTSGLKAAIHNVRAAGRRVGVALNPNSSVTLLTPILREIDEVMVMAVAPGAAGQTFDPDVLRKISILAGTRKKYGLKFIISVDGGINETTARLCWDAGADWLVSGSYLACAPDFPLAVQSLMKKNGE